MHPNVLRMATPQCFAFGQNGCDQPTSDGDSREQKEKSRATVKATSPCLGGPFLFMDPNMITWSSPIGWLARAASLPLVLLWIGGCGSGNNSLVPVEGRVWIQGQVLSGGTIVFVPDEEKGHHGRMAMAVIEPSGVYRLLTDKLPGAEPGWYRVSIAPADSLGGLRIAKKFSDPNHSGIHREIRPGMPNSIDITLD